MPGDRDLAYNAEKVINAEIDFRDEFKLTTNGFSEWKRGFWAAPLTNGSSWNQEAPDTWRSLRVKQDDTFLPNRFRLLHNSCPDLPPAQPAGERDQLYARGVFGRNHPFCSMQIRRIKEISYNNPRWGRIVSPADTYARELIDEVDSFRHNCEIAELRVQAQHLIEQIRFSEITLAGAEHALASLERHAHKETKE
jgi:hypothetical protein